MLLAGRRNLRLRRLRTQRTAAVRHPATDAGDMAAAVREAMACPEMRYAIAALRPVAAWLDELAEQDAKTRPARVSGQTGPAGAGRLASTTTPLSCRD